MPDFSNPAMMMPPYGFNPMNPMEMNPFAAMAA
jgi:hypothetical protein